MRSIKIIIALAFITAMSFMTGCRVQVAGRNRPLIQHGPVHGEAEITAQHQSSENNNESSDKKSDNLTFREILRFQTNGDVYHPNLLTYGIGAGLILDQSRTKTDEEVISSQESPTEYNLSLDFLRAKPYSLSIRANKAEDVMSRLFNGPLRIKNENQNAHLKFNVLQGWPMRFNYSKNERNISEFASTRSEPPTTTIEEIYSYTLNRNNEDSSSMTEFGYDHSKYDYFTGPSESSTVSDFYSLSNNFLFGSEYNWNLFSLLTYNDRQLEEGSLKDLFWREELRINHTEDFETRYSSSFKDNQRTRRDINDDREEITGNVSFKHELYDSLTTVGGLNVRRNEFNDIITEEFSQNLGLSYSKLNPWGVFHADFSILNSTTTQTGGDDSVGIVFDEVHSVPIGAFPTVELNKVGIDIDTIDVHTIGGVSYTEGSDYYVTEINGRVQLEIILNGGTFPEFTTPGQVFFVDYEFAVEPDRTEDHISKIYQIRQDFDNGISIFFRASEIENDIDSSDDNVFPYDSKNMSYGISYIYKGLNLRVSKNDVDSTMIDSEQELIYGSYGWRVSEDTFARIMGQIAWQDETVRDGEQRDRTSFRLRGELDRRLTDKYSLNTQVNYMEDSDSLSGDTDGFQVSVDLRYKIRQLSFLTGVDYNIRNRSDFETNSLYVHFSMKREF